MSTSKSNLAEIYKQNSRDDFAKLLREYDISSKGLDKYDCFQLIADEEVEINGIELDPDEVRKEKHNLINSYKGQSKTIATKPVTHNDTSHNEETFQETKISTEKYTKAQPTAFKADAQLTHTDSLIMESLRLLEEQLKISNRRYDELATKYETLWNSQQCQQIPSKQTLRSSEIKHIISANIGYDLTRVHVFKKPFEDGTSVFNFEIWNREFEFYLLCSGLSDFFKSTDQHAYFKKMLKFLFEKYDRLPTDREIEEVVDYFDQIIKLKIYSTVPSREAELLLTDKNATSSKFVEILRRNSAEGTTITHKRILETFNGLLTYGYRRSPNDVINVIKDMERAVRVHNMSGPTVLSWLALTLIKDQGPINYINLSIKDPIHLDDPIHIANLYSQLFQPSQLDVPTTQLDVTKTPLGFMTYGSNNNQGNHHGRKSSSMQSNNSKKGHSYYKTSGDYKSKKGNRSKSQ